MADYKFGDGIKTILLAGIGAVAVTAEKSSQVVNDLVKRGELTVEQGKELNKELKHNVKETLNKKSVDVDEIESRISKMSSDELAKLKEQIAEAEKKAAEKAEKIKAEEDPAQDSPAEDKEGDDKAE